jgi:hypothetical protein
MRNWEWIILRGASEASTDSVIVGLSAAKSTTEENKRNAM